MPWKVTCHMEERMRFVLACADEVEAFSVTCRRFGISRNTGYKWLARFNSEGPTAFAERPPRALVAPHRIADSIAAPILALRKERPNWGPRKLRSVLMDQRPDVAWPAASTIGDVLKRHGLIHPRRRRVHASPSDSPLVTPKEANELWCTDFKGHFGLGDKSRCTPLTITDDASRYLLKCEGLLRTDTAPVKAQFELTFREFGLPLRMRSDNGPPFASVGPGGLSALSVWWIKLGITPERIEPGEPQQNGRHERMHRSLKLEVEVRGSLLEQQPVLDRFRRDFNELRPHEALGLTPPARHYSASRRVFPETLIVPEYIDHEVRWTDTVGRVKFHGHVVPVGTCLAGEPIGFRQVGESKWEAFFGPASLGILDDKAAKPRLKAKPPVLPHSPPANGPGDGSAFSYGQLGKADLPTGKPPAPEDPDLAFWREERA